MGRRIGEDEQPPISFRSVSVTFLFIFCRSFTWVVLFQENLKKTAIRACRNRSDGVKQLCLVNLRVVYPPVAKLDIAVDSDSKGRGFESLRADQVKSYILRDQNVAFFVVLQCFSGYRFCSSYTDLRSAIYDHSFFYYEVVKVIVLVKEPKILSFSQV